MKLYIGLSTHIHFLPSKHTRNQIIFLKDIFLRKKLKKIKKDINLHLFYNFCNALRYIYYKIKFQKNILFTKDKKISIIVTEL